MKLFIKMKEFRKVEETSKKLENLIATWHEDSKKIKKFKKLRSFKKPFTIWNRDSWKRNSESLKKISTRNLKKVQEN